MKQAPWTERHFEADLPLSLFPGVLERLRGTPARLEDRLRGRAPEILQRRKEGAWSIQEHSGHLFDLESLWWGRMEDLAAGREEMRAANLANPTTTAADFNAQPLAGILSSFRGARMNMVDRLAEWDEPALARTSRHPRLGVPMRAIDLSVFIAEHDDHHLARISELIREWG